MHTTPHKTGICKQEETTTRNENVNMIDCIHNKHKQTNKQQKNGKNLIATFSNQVDN
jgi:hypothetical protein